MGRKITREEIRGHYSERLMTDIHSRVAETGDFLGFARQFMHDEDEQVARNALSGLTKATDTELAQLKPILDEMTELAMKTESPSILRPLLGIIERQTMTEDDLRADFLDFCLARMTAPAEAPSVQALCMKLAWKMCKFHPELMDELTRTLEAMEPAYYKPAVKSVRRRILATVR